MIKSYRNMLDGLACNRCNYANKCFLRKMPLYLYPEQIQIFMINMPAFIFNYREEEKRWHANYRGIQEQLVQYYNIHAYGLLNNKQAFLTNAAQKESDRQRIREYFKYLLDGAARLTEDKNPGMSIMFDELGLLLASDYLDAVSKVISIMKTVAKSNYDVGMKCFGKQ